jgi:thiol-disulfide isomerase/thioredoxin
MKPNCFRLGLLAAALLAFPTVYAADLKPGGKAPEVKVAEWVKGKPFKSYAESDYTVVEFWATWCGPCIEAIPHVTELAKKHAGKVAFYGVSVWENGDDIPGQVKKFVADMGEKMDYNVARDDEQAFMAKNWMEAANQNGIPASFLMDKKGTLLWVGHPMDLEATLDEVLAGRFDMAASVKKFDEEAAAVAKQTAMMKQIEEAKELYAKGHQKEGLAKLEAIEVAGDLGTEVVKKLSKLQMLMNEPRKANAYMDELVKEGSTTNSQVLVQFAFGVNEKSSDSQKSLAMRGLREGVKLDSNNPITYLNAGYGWIMLGRKAKALEMLEMGEKLLPTSEFKDDEQLKNVFADLKKQAKS